MKLRSLRTTLISIFNILVDTCDLCIFEDKDIGNSHVSLTPFTVQITIIITIKSTQAYEVRPEVLQGPIIN